MTKRSEQELNQAQRKVVAGLRKLPDSYVQCRGMMHAWEVLNDFRITGTPGERGPRFLRRDLECMRCTTVRHDTYLLRFVKGEPLISEKAHASYTYPENYQIPGIPRGVKRHVIVYQEQFRRAMEAAGGAVPGQREVSD